MTIQFPLCPSRRLAAPWLLAALVACSSTTTTPRDERCTVGATEPCVCPDGSASRRECEADGAFGACDCGGEGGAGGDPGTSGGAMEMGGGAGEDSDSGGSRSGGAAGQTASSGGASDAGAPGSGGAPPGGAPGTGGTSDAGAPSTGGTSDAGAPSTGGTSGAGAPSTGGTPEGGTSGSGGAPAGGEGGSLEGGAGGAADCAWGSQDNDGDGVCLPDCNSAALSCPAHAACTDSSGAATCACVPGYVGSPGSCVWAVTPADPSFQDDPAGSWALSGGVELRPGASALVAPGNVTFDRPTICDQNGSVAQTVTLPRFEDAEPMQVELTARGTCAADFDSCVVSPVNVLFNGGAMSFDTSNVYATFTRCLGERAFGVTAPLSIRHGARSAGCAADRTAYLLEVDHLQIKPNAACPAPRTILNPDFEGDENWTATVGSGTSGYADGAGVGGSRAWRLQTVAATCQSPGVVGIASWPMGDGAALEVSLTGTAGKALLLGDPLGNPWAEYLGSGGALARQTVCIPEYARGMVSPLRLQTSNSSGGCANGDARTFDIDAMTFVTGSQCPADASLLDPGFELSTGRIRYWALASNDNGHPGSVSSTIVNDATVARGGSRALVLTSTQLCTSASARAVLTVPAPNGTAGPALRFFYARTGAAGDLSIYVASEIMALEEQSAYAERTLCLDPAAAGQGLTVQLQLSGGSGTCANTIPEVRATFDDFEVTTDPACPAL